MQRPDNKWLVALAVSFGALMATIDISIVNVALPQIRGSIGASLDEITAIATSYAIAQVIVMPLTAFLGRFFGQKRVYLFCLGLFLVGSTVCGFARTLPTLVMARILQGFGAGALQPSQQAILRQTFPAREQGMAMAVVGMAVMIGPALGPTLGGWIVDNYNWPWIFYINVPLGIVAALMTYTYVHDAEHQERAETVDVLGFLLLATCVGSLQFMLEKGERYDWFDSRLVTSLAIVSAASLVLLIWRELTIKEPIINFRVLKSRQLAAGVSIAAVLGLALFGSIFILPIFLQNLHGLTANQTGLVILPGAIASAVTMAFVGKNANRMDARVTVTIGAMMFFVSMWMLSRMTLASGPEETFWPLILRGVGLGLIFVPLTGATMAEMKNNQLAQGTGMFNLTRQLGGSMGIAIMATLLTRFTAAKKAVLTEHVTTMDPASLGRLDQLTHGLMARGINPIVAKQQALFMLDRQIGAQASVLAFSRIYILSGIILLAALPLLLLFKTGKGRGSAGMAH